MYFARQLHLYDPGVYFPYKMALMNARLTSTKTRQEEDNMSKLTQPVFILIHGAWHGGWVWQTVAKTLRQQGYTVYTPTLTGLGERSHLLNDTITLDTFISDIINLIKWENQD